jgi:cell division protein FtsL
MEPINFFVHAYKQAPWRIQRQWVSFALLFVLCFAMIASLYLMVTSRAAIVGREIQNLREEITKTEHANADLQTRLANLTSKANIDQRAYALGYHPVDSEELEYLVVPGFSMPEGAQLANAPELHPSPPSLPTVYTESLLEWMDRELHLLGESQ